MNSFARRVSPFEVLGKSRFIDVVVVDVVGVYSVPRVKIHLWLESVALAKQSIALCPFDLNGLNPQLCCEPSAWCRHRPLLCSLTEPCFRWAPVLLGDRRYAPDRSGQARAKASAGLAHTSLQDPKHRLSAVLPTSTVGACAPLRPSLAQCRLPACRTS